MSYFWFLVVCIFGLIIWKKSEKSKQYIKEISDQQKKLYEQNKQLDLMNNKLNRVGDFERVIQSLNAQIEEIRAKYVVKKIIWMKWRIV